LDADISFEIRTQHYMCALDGMLCIVSVNALCIDIFNGGTRFKKWL